MAPCANCKASASSSLPMRCSVARPRRWVVIWDVARSPADCRHLLFPHRVRAHRGPPTSAPEWRRGPARRPDRLPDRTRLPDDPARRQPGRHPTAAHSPVASNGPKITLSKASCSGLSGSRKEFMRQQSQNRLQPCRKRSSDNVLSRHVTPKLNDKPMANDQVPGQPRPSASSIGPNQRSSSPSMQCA